MDGAKELGLLPGMLARWKYCEGCSIYEINIVVIYWQKPILNI
jgi:hypothetical protein